MYSYPANFCTFLGRLFILLSQSCHFFIFCQGALFRGKGGPPVFEYPAQHLPRQGRGFIRPPIQPCHLLNLQQCYMVFWGFLVMSVSFTLHLFKMMISFSIDHFPILLNLLHIFFSLFSLNIPCVSCRVTFLSLLTFASHLVFLPDFLSGTKFLQYFISFSWIFL